MIQILVIRDTFTQKSTIGKLYINGDYICNTLEDPVRANGVKIKGDTAIEQGVYKVSLTRSKRFGRTLPLLLNVPMFSGVRIHGGNRPENTEGCILVGLNRGDDFIWGSPEPLRDIVDRLLGSSEAYISIHNKI